MIRLSVVHLSGARRGKVDVLATLPVTIGSGPEGAVRPEALPLRTHRG
jgi:hypothetical protein